MKLGALYVGDHCVLPRVWRAENAWERARGLLGRPALKTGEGFWIEPCASVHTIGMGYSLDLAFIDANGCVARLAHDVKPLRMASQFGARATLETAAGELSTSILCTGSQVKWREIMPSAGTQAA
ncbi:MAG: DUF192 domain-containing protein [Rhodocyclaceae bacterium]|nr:DUF192 domain-containing protein [Rhodocyclaceae bacterium]